MANPDGMAGLLWEKGTGLQVWMDGLFVRLEAKKERRVRVWDATVAWHSLILGP